MSKYCVMFTLLLFYTACNKEAKYSTYKEHKVVYLNSIRWGDEELQELSQKMVQNILSSKNIKLINRQKYTFDKITNDTYDHIDTKMLKNNIISSLTKTTKFEFIENTQSKELYIFKGKLSSFFKKSNNKKDMFFSFNLMLLHPSTLEVIWSNDIEIRKTYKRPLFSW